MLITRDCNGLNGGSFLVRRSEWSRAFLTEVGCRVGRGGVVGAGVGQTDKEMQEFSRVVPLPTENLIPCPYWVPGFCGLRPPRVWVPPHPPQKKQEPAVIIRARMCMFL